MRFKVAENDCGRLAHMVLRNNQEPAPGRFRHRIVRLIPAQFAAGRWIVSCLVRCRAIRHAPYG